MNSGCETAWCNMYACSSVGILFCLIWNRWSAYGVAEVPRNFSGNYTSVLFKYFIIYTFTVPFSENLGTSTDNNVLFYGELPTLCRKLMIDIVQKLKFGMGPCAIPLNNQRAMWQSFGVHLPSYLTHKVHKGSFRNLTH